MNLRTRTLNRTRRRGAFTLVEMVMALGIVGFAFMAMVGMLPIGMNLFRQAMDLTAKPQMVQHIMGDLDQLPYAQLQGAQGRTYYFDDSGNVLDKDDASAIAGAIYKATVDLNLTTTLPGGALTPNEGLATVTLTFTRVQAAATNTAPPIKFVSYVSDRYRPTTTTQ